MKPLAFVILGLVASLILTNLPAPSYADPQLDSLVNIATQARDNIRIQLSQLSTIPDEINNLYKQGSDETDALAQSVSQADGESSKTHFLSAMKIFKTVNDNLASLTSTNEQQSKIDTLPLIGEINRMQKLGDKLKSISQDNNVEIDFTKFDELMKNARQNLVASNIDQVKQDLQTANQFLLDSRHILADAANKKTSDRAKDFTNKQIERLSADVPVQNGTQPIVPPENPIPETTNSSQTQNLPDMIAKLKQFVSEGNVDEALKLLKLINNFQIQERSTQVSTPETLNATQPTNENNINTPEISNSIDNSATTQTTTTTPTQIPLNVKSVDLSGNPIPGLSTTVKIGSTTTIQSGFTPLSYTATSGTTYTITVSNYQNYVFDHWNDGSKNRSISVTPTKETTLTAYYKTPTTSTSKTTTPTQIPLNVKSVGLDGSPIPGLATIIRIGGTTVQTGYTPLSYSGTSGTTYTITVSNYQNYVFDHWNDGSKNRSISVTPTKETTLTAYYKISIPHKETVNNGNATQNTKSSSDNPSHNEIAKRLQEKNRQ